ncbi:nucleoside hydrolase [Nonomuraea rubra]|uniref:Inosine-uridine nucleoside N-ribohydrolase n=1 Tax=Nonomuraea rubra TaxID=46180 RepID=A0A7X0TXE4_9ACTN|nr:nucleoside hydrolase [Nonomuraea rubra]MBB6547318.1 inosine-uridine nucleoside N-ribohydrolase [Nonomuraea rubra]
MPGFPLLIDTDTGSDDAVALLLAVAGSTMPTTGDNDVRTTGDYGVRMTSDDDVRAPDVSDMPAPGDDGMPPLTGTDAPAASDNDTRPTGANDVPPVSGGDAHPVGRDAPRVGRDDVVSVPSGGVRAGGVPAIGGSERLGDGPVGGRPVGGRLVSDRPVSDRPVSDRPSGGGGEVLAVTTVAGNVPLATATRNALITLEMAGQAGVPVHPGCDRPLTRPPSTAQHVHGLDGMGDVGLPEPARGPAEGHAVDVLLSLPRRHPGELTLVTLGPLTNLAAALLRDRELLTRFRHVYCMAGAADMRGNVSPTAEFNVWADPEAARVVLQAATPDRVTWIGWDVSRKYAVMTPDDQRHLESLGTPLAAFAHRINRTVADWARNVTGLAGYDLPDPVAMAVALRPELVLGSEQAHVDVAVGDETRGQLVIDRRRSAPPPNLTLVRRVDEQGFKQLLFDALTAATPVPARTTATPTKTRTIATPADARSTATPADARSTATPADARSTAHI